MTTGRATTTATITTRTDPEAPPASREHHRGPDGPPPGLGRCSDIRMTGFRTLPAGQQVDLIREASGCRQDGCDYRGVNIAPRSA